LKRVLAGREAGPAKSATCSLFPHRGGRGENLGKREKPLIEGREKEIDYFGMILSKQQLIRRRGGTSPVV